MDRNIKTVLLSEEEIHSRVAELGKQITQRYVGEDIVCIGVLKGCFIFMADLVRCIDLPAAIDFMVISSYGNGTSSGDITVKKDLSCSIEGKHVLIVEDILDSGHTLTFLKQYLAAHNPASIEVAVLLNKQTHSLYWRRNGILCKFFVCILGEKNFIFVKLNDLLIAGFYLLGGIEA